MTTAWREIKESRSNGEQAGRKFTTRVFQDDVTPDVIRNQPECPLIGDKLPWDADQEVVDISVIPVPNSVSTSKVAVTYDTGGATWGGANPSDPFFKSWSLSYFRIVQEIPYAIRDTRTHRYVDNNVIKFITSYPVANNPIYESRMKFIRRVRVTNFQVNQWEAIAAQANKLHKIYTRWYLFTIGDIVELSRNTWDATYTFEYDPGTPNIFLNTASDPDISLPWSNQALNAMYPGVLYCRPPFHRFLTIPQYSTLTNSPSWPVFRPILDFELNQTGHLTLPGFTL